MAVPINKWVHLEVFYKYGQITTYESNYYRGNGSGSIIVFQDGIEIYRFENVATTAANNWVSDRWMVTAYAAADGAASGNSQTVAVVTPTVAPIFKVLVDDAAISTVRLSAPRELIRNGDFPTEVSYWRNDNPPRATLTFDSSAGLSANSPGAAKMNVSNPSSAFDEPNLYQPIKGGLRPGITYTLRFTGKSTVTRDIQAVIYSNSYTGGPFGTYGEIEDGGGLDWDNYWDDSCGLVQLPANQIQNFVCDLSVSQIITSGVLGFHLGETNSVVTLDNISLVENQNLIPNGDFDESPAWMFYNNASASSYAKVTNGGLSANNTDAGKVTITSTGAVDDPELYHAITGTLDAGITYTLRFTAKSTINRDIQVTIHDFDGDPTSLWWEDNCGTVSLTANPQNFVCAFQPLEPTTLPTTTLSVGFLLGDFTGNGSTPYDITIDNVSLSRNN